MTTPLSLTSSRYTGQRRGDRWRGFPSSPASLPSRSTPLGFFLPRRSASPCPSRRPPLFAPVRVGYLYRKPAALRLRRGEEEGKAGAPTERVWVRTPTLALRTCCPG